MSASIHSVDPVIRHVASRYEMMRGEKQHLSNMLLTYAGNHVAQPKDQPVVSVLAHYQMSERTPCGCSTCTEWVTRRNEFVEALKLVPVGHKWSTCSCYVCRFVGRIQLNHLAAANSRDLLIEMSYHAKYHSPYGTEVMAWLEDELKRPMYTVNWRAQEMNRYPMEWWLRKCEAVLGPIVSGTVFRASMMVTDLKVHFGSSLLADGEITA